MHFKEKFHWINEGEVVLEENRIIMMAPALTDFFCGETTSEEGNLAGVFMQCTILLH